MKPGREFRVIEGVALFLSCIAIQINSEVLAQWGFYFYSPPAQSGQTIYVAVGLAGVIFVVGLLIDAFSDPIIGLWSDKTQTRATWRRIIPISGRRRPFIFWGSIGITFTGIAFWYPPIAGTSVVNFVYATAIICLHSAFFFTIIAIPFNSLGPELARSDEARVRIGNWIAAGMIVGLAVAIVAPGVLVAHLDPNKGQTAAAATPVADAAPASEAAEDLPPAASPVGYQRTAIVLSLVSFLLFQFTVWTVKERYQSDLAPARTPSIKVLIQAVSNTVFLRYAAIFFMFNIGLLGVQRVLPHWVRIGLGGTTETVSLLMIPFIVMALVALAFMPALSRRVPLKWLLFASLAIIASGLPFMYVIAVSPASAGAKTIMGASLFGFCGIGQGMLYVLLTPLIGQIIDLDETRTGERREAAYQALHGLNWKASQALAVFVAAQSMHLLGNSAESPLGIYILGPMAGVFGLIGMAVCWTYPVLPSAKAPGSP